MILYGMQSPVAVRVLLAQTAILVNLNDKNSSLSIALTAMDQKLQKS